VGLTGLGRTRPDGHRHDVSWSPEQVDRHVAVVRDAAQRAGRRVPGLEALVQVLVITEQREEVLGPLATRLDVPEQYLTEIPYILVGTLNQIVEQLAAARQRWGITRYVARDDAVDAAETVAAALRG
jgi:alkanesulfonate monooxygenase SsuD/methylene tetrahydromethanopterin reductase-like flavin-dependent oxidoreductase (luciferase family)